MFNLKNWFTLIWLGVFSHHWLTACKDLFYYDSEQEMKVLLIIECRTILATVLFFINTHLSHLKDIYQILSPSANSIVTWLYKQTKPSCVR